MKESTTGFRDTLSSPEGRSETSPWNVVSIVWETHSKMD